MESGYITPVSDGGMSKTPPEVLTRPGLPPRRQTGHQRTAKTSSLFTDLLTKNQGGDGGANSNDLAL